MVRQDPTKADVFTGVSLAVIAGTQRGVLGEHGTRHLVRRGSTNPNEGGGKTLNIFVLVVLQANLHNS